jgi:hypothetical protein
MKPNDFITLTAFLTALQKLDSALPPNIQTQLNDIGQHLENNPNDIGNLDIIFESYSNLDIIYQQELTSLKKQRGQRSKGLEPDPLPINPTNELTNAAINTFKSRDSVSAAQENLNPNLLRKIRNFLTGNQANE